MVILTEMKFHFRWQNITLTLPKMKCHCMSIKILVSFEIQPKWKVMWTELVYEQNLFTRRLEISYRFECISPPMWTYSKPINKTFWNVIYVSHLKMKRFINTFLYVLNSAYCFSLKIFLIWMCTIFILIGQVVL